MAVTETTTKTSAEGKIDYLKRALSSGRLVAAGNDSTVYQYEGIALKVYKKHLSEDTLTLYKDVTNQANQLAEIQNWQINFRYSKLRFPVKINPFINLTYLPKDIVVGESGWIGISSYVEGQRLEEAVELVEEKEARVALRDLNFDLTRKLNVCGIDLVPRNLKIIDEPGRQVFVVTDLCADISRLKRIS